MKADEVKLAVVIATCRPESFERWAQAWGKAFEGIPVYVVQDAPKKTTLAPLPGVWTHYGWRDIDRDLGSRSWIIPRRSSAIKSYGFLKAYQDGFDYIWTLDDDCLPDPGYEYPYVPRIRAMLACDQASDAWYNTIPNSGLYPRGYPYGVRQETQPVMIHHGLWAGVPDLDGITALEHGKVRFKSFYGTERVPTGQFFPMCGMNLAFRRAMAPAMYFGLQGKMLVNDGWTEEPLPFDRFDDIWAGLFAKKVADHMEFAVTSGGPSILHTKESDPTQRVIKEGPGIAAHEILWPIVADHRIPFGLNTVKGSYSDLAVLVDSRAGDLPYPEYWRKLAKAMQIWTELF